MDATGEVLEHIGVVQGSSVAGDLSVSDAAVASHALSTANGPVHGSFRPVTNVDCLMQNDSGSNLTRIGDSDASLFYFYMPPDWTRRPLSAG